MPRFSALPDTAAIAVEGVDAGPFLNAQLSREIPPSAADGAAIAPLAAWHDARGRVRALFRVLPLANGWLLVTERAMVAAVLATLPKYVLRSRVKLREAAEWRFGLVLDADDAWLATQELAPLPRDRLVPRGTLCVVGLGANLALLAGTDEATAAFAATLPAAPASAATLAAIRAGLPAIVPATSERFVAQMLNLDGLDAVSFTKGCYPGQEVIARVRYRGDVKRHLRRYAADDRAVPAPGTELVGDDGTVVGDTVLAAPAEHGVELLAVVEDSATTVRTAAGATLEPRPALDDAT